MCKKILLFSVYFLAFAVTVVNLVYVIRGSIFSDINDLPQGKYVLSVTSPDKNNTINMYKIDNSIGKAVRCELKANGKTKNVFWQTGIIEADINWISDRNVVINGVELDVIAGGVYDCRRGVSLFQDGAIEGDEVKAINR